MLEQAKQTDSHADREQELIDSLEAIIRGDFSVRPSGQDKLSRTVAELIDHRKESVTAALDRAVLQSITANETSMSSGKILSASREVDVRTQSIAAAIEEMVASVQGIAQSTSDTSSYVDSVEQAAAEGRSAVDRAVSTMGMINSAVTGAASQVDTLAKASENIGAMVASIEKIAAQTNLLALNATIEAARAGEAGKGFAVVASEVKNLSNQTAQATLDIRERIEQLKSEMTVIVESMSKGAEAVAEGQEVMGSVGEGMSQITGRVEGVKVRMQEITSILEQQTEAANEVSHGVTSIASMTKDTVSQIETTADALDESVAELTAYLGVLAQNELPGKVVRLAKADHVIWKKKLSDMLVGRTKLKDDELADHHSCRLGKWYYSDQAAAFRQYKEFAELEGPHARVHNHGKAAARCYNNGDLEGALGEIAEVEEASKDVLRLLDALRVASS